MDELERFIAAYRLRASSSARARLKVLMALEPIHDPRVVLFFADVLQDRREAAELRAFALRQIRCRSELTGSATQRALAGAIGDVLADRTNSELRIQAALALGDFTHLPGVLCRLNAVCLAQAESIDLRYAAFTSLERAVPTPECVALLRRMTTDETLGLSARSVLSAWHIE
jgi:HEAT repeat protein